MELKSKLKGYILELINANIDAAQKALNAAEESRNSETKSSAGDKYETGRALMQAEMDKNRVQLARAFQQKNQILKIVTEKRSKVVDYGSLVFTDQGIYFISLGLGKITIGHEDYFAISLASPMGSVLKDKQMGDEVVLNERKIVIKDIY